MCPPEPEEGEEEPQPKVNFPPEMAKDKLSYIVESMIDKYNATSEEPLGQKLPIPEITDPEGDKVYCELRLGSNKNYNDIIQNE